MEHSVQKRLKYKHTAMVKCVKNIEPENETTEFTEKLTFLCGYYLHSILLNGFKHEII